MNYPTNNPATVLSTGPNSAPYVVLRLAWSEGRLSDQTHPKLGAIQGNAKNEVRKATGYRFDALTQSEAGYLALFKQVESVRARIVAEAGKTADERNNVAPLVVYIATMRTADERFDAERFGKKYGPAMSIHTLTDEQLLLALCILREQLEDPVEWCREFRQVSLDTHAGPKTSDKAHALMARRDRLREAIKKAPAPDQ